MVQCPGGCLGAISLRDCHRSRHPQPGSGSTALESQLHLVLAPLFLLAPSNLMLAHVFCCLMFPLSTPSVCHCVSFVVSALPCAFHSGRRHGWLQKPLTRSLRLWCASDFVCLKGCHCCPSLGQSSLNNKDDGATQLVRTSRNSCGQGWFLSRAEPQEAFGVVGLLSATPLQPWHSDMLYTLLQAMV